MDLIRGFCFVLFRFFCFYWDPRQLFRGRYGPGGGRQSGSEQITRRKRAQPRKPRRRVPSIGFFSENRRGMSWLSGVTWCPADSGPPIGYWSIDNHQSSSVFNFLWHFFLSTWSYWPWRVKIPVRIINMAITDVPKNIILRTNKLRLDSFVFLVNAAICRTGWKRNPMANVNHVESYFSFLWNRFKGPILCAK